MLNVNVAITFTEEDFKKAVEVYDRAELYTIIEPYDAVYYVIDTKFDMMSKEDTDAIINKLSAEQKQSIIAYFKKAYFDYFTKVLNERLGATELE